MSGTRTERLRLCAACFFPISVLLSCFCNIIWCKNAKQRLLTVYMECTEHSLPLLWDDLEWKGDRYAWRKLDLIISWVSVEFLMQIGIGCYLICKTLCADSSMLEECYSVDTSIWIFKWKLSSYNETTCSILLFLGGRHL